MINDNMATVLEALGEKLSNMKSALGYEEWRSRDLEAEIAKLKDENSKLRDEAAHYQRKYNELTDRLNEYCTGGNM